TSCEQPLEIVQGFNDARLTECPACEGRLRQVFSAVGVVFKGSGFYRNDSRGSKSGSDGGSTAAKSDAKAESKSDSSAGSSSESSSSSSAASAAPASSPAPSTPAPKSGEGGKVA
ncbi:MAG: hypothetical protein QOC60_546, partial [Frankiaceae bacterium]|nr:hypothetical protein [Frankiaceae bacterium]